MTSSTPNLARALAKLGGTLLRAAALALATLPSAWAYSSVELTVGGTLYTVAFTQQRTYNQCTYAITHAPWWGNKTLAQNLAAALGGRLGAPTVGTYGPLFAFQTYGAGPTGVDNAAWNISNTIATSNGNGWPVNSNGVYAVDPSQVDSAGNCTVADLQTAAPFLESVTPASGPTAGGTAITLSGNNFTGATAVTIGGAAAGNVHVVSDTTITATTPAGTLGNKSVLVTTPGGTNTANTLFAYKQAQAALAALATPGTIAVGGTSALGTTGGSGGGAVSFQLDSGPCTLTGSQLTGTAQGTCAVTATKAADSSYFAATATASVTVVPAAPILQSVTPASGPTAGGTAITLSGSNFTGATAVTIGGAAAGNVHVVNDTTITATTPTGTPGSQSVLVTTPSGTSAASAWFTYAKQAQAALAALATPAAITVGSTSALGTSGGSGGGSVSFQLDSGPCTLAGSQLTGTAQGTCAVTATKAADSNYLAATATASVTVAPAPVDAVCASLPATSFKPTTGLCSAGALNPAGVSRAAHQWAWTCDGAHGGTAAACTADLGATGNQSGLAAVELGTGGWVLAPQGNGALETSGFIPVTGHPKSPPSLPPGYGFPHALFDFVLTGGAGAATLTITYPEPLPAGAVYWKYGPSPAGYNCTGTACTAPHWYQMPPSQAVIAGNTVTLTILDGGVGDDDLAANGVIVDQGGPGVALAAPAGGPAAIPTLSEWALAALAAAMLLLGLRAARRGGRAPRS